MIRINIKCQPRYGNSTESGKMVQWHRRSFMISIIFIPCRLPSMLFHKVVNMIRHLTGGWDMPSIIVTTSSLFSRNYRSDIWRRITNLALNYTGQFPNLVSFIRIMVSNCGQMQFPRRWIMWILPLISCIMESVYKMVTIIFFVIWYLTWKRKTSDTMRYS